MAETQGRKRSNGKAQAAEEEAVKASTEEEQTAQGEQAAAAESPEPPAPNDPEPAAPPTDDGGTETGEGEYAHSALTENPQLLDATPELVSAVLASAPDPISLADARARIEAFRSTPLPTSSTEEA